MWAIPGAVWDAATSNPNLNQRRRRRRQMQRLRTKNLEIMIRRRIRTKNGEKTNMEKKTKILDSSAVKHDFKKNT